MFQHIAHLSDSSFNGLVAVVGLTFLLLILKLIFGKKSVKKTQEPFEFPSKSVKKRKAKKQKPIAQDKKASDSPKARIDQKSKVSSLVETKKPVFEEKSDKRKDGGKTKSKSKKKKTVVAAKNETIQESFVKDHNFDDGGWKTISTKEQREQLKREKRKLEEATTLSKDSIIEKFEQTPLVQMHKPIHNPAIAKGIAPRFARAAGAEWQDKPTFSAVNQPLQSKRPMPPATVPGTTKAQVEQTTVTQQAWNQGNPTWQESLGWPLSTPTALPSNLMSYSSDPAHLLSMAQSTGKTSPDVWPQGGGVSWQSSEFRSANLLTRDSSPSHSSSCGEAVSLLPHIERTPYKSQCMQIQSEPSSFCHSNDFLAAKLEQIQRGSHNSNSSWDINGEEWVHVNGANNKMESWQASEKKSQAKDDPWMIEPEGISLRQPQIDCDPWGMEMVEQDVGDWSAPTASWDNANAEWKVPSPTEPQATYVGESSEEEAAPVKLPSNSTQPESQSVVGISQESASQKKSRRRRKKKNLPSEQTLPSPLPEVVLPKPEETKAEESVTEPKPTEASEDWSVSKASKKRRVKPRKAD